MKKLKNKLLKFMYGRYGIDDIYWTLFGIVFVLLFINLFTQQIFIDIITAVILGVATLRAFSKNITKRRMENRAFLNMIQPIRKSLLLTIRRIKEIKTARFRKCPNCKQSMRLQAKKGKHTVVCPKCKQKVTVKIRF